MNIILNKEMLLFLDTMVLLFNRSIIKRSIVMTVICYIAAIIANITYIIGTYKYLQGFELWVKFLAAIVYFVLYSVLLIVAFISIKKYGPNPRVTVRDNDGNIIGSLPPERELFIDSLHKAEQGEGMYMLNMALFYRRGTGCRRNLKKAKQWAIRASKCNEPIWVEEAKKILPKIEEDIAEDHRNAIDYISSVFDV